MEIDPQACVACLGCLPFCPVSAIRAGADGRPRIDGEACVECGTCRRSSGCPVEAHRQPVLSWPRVLRALFSDPQSVHRLTAIPGRGTEELKTNDVTGRVGPGELLIVLDIGRPGVSTTFAEVEIVAAACLRGGAAFEPMNPLTRLMADRERGTFPEVLRRERVLSVCLEMVIRGEHLARIIRSLRQCAAEIDTVFSLGLGFLDERGAFDEISRSLNSLGVEVSSRGKINLGLGRPLARFAGRAGGR